MAVEATKLNGCRMSKRQLPKNKLRDRMMKNLTIVE
jgi:hypothetical protein